VKLTNRLKNSLKLTFLGSALALAIAVPSQAAVVTLSFTVQQLENAILAGGPQGTCLANLSNCGVYSVGLYSDTVNGVTSTSPAVISYISPVPSGNGAWVGNPTGFSGPFAAAAIQTNDSSSAAGSNGVFFITTNGNTAGNTYTDFPVQPQVGLGAISAGTELGFNVNVATVSYGSSASVTLELAAEHFDVHGVQLPKGSSFFTTMNVTQTPEPSSIILLFSGVAVVALRRRFCS
jgi:hypothetical protein